MIQNGPIQQRIVDIASRAYDNQRYQSREEQRRSEYIIVGRSEGNEHIRSKRSEGKWRKMQQIILHQGDQRGADRK